MTPVLPAHRAFVARSAHPGYASAAVALRDVLAGAGLDRARLGRASWNPLGDVIAPGARVCIKPNWVHHENPRGGGLECLVTHPTLVAGVVEYARKATTRIVLGDAPIQGCDLDTLLGALHMRQLAGDCDIRDFRLVHVRGGRFFNQQQPSGRRREDYVLFDLGRESLLEPITERTTEFRVGMYAPEEMAQAHAPGRHLYLVCREVIDADVVIDMPKLKTHGRAGLTAALKNVVGITGEKSYLAHHRKGGTLQGGDCYPGREPLKQIAEELMDASSRRSAAVARGTLSGLAATANRLNELLGSDRNVHGAWYGNDTVWRMTLDLQRILRYGRADGTLAAEPQRQILHVTDGIIAGQGAGPLAPEPLPLGVVTLGTHAGVMDWVHALLMGFDPRRIPIVSRAFERPSALAHLDPREIEIALDGVAVRPDELVKAGTRATPAPGWRGHIELA